MKKIIKITEIKGIDMLNKHNNCVFKNQRVWIIKLENNKQYLLDIKGNKDITNVDYLSLIETKKTQYNVLFEDEILN